MLSGQQLKFATLYALQKNAADAYRAAYPNSAPASAERSGSRLLKNVEVKAKIEEIRAKAVTKAALTLAEVHDFLARVVRSQPALLERDSDLWQSIKQTESGTEYRLPDKLGCISRWCDLRGEGSQAEAQDALAGLLERVMK
jgi:hypothetical protein